ncbi:MAG: purine-nucleoside phosphorylase [Candidatus Bruticola sp.]
MISSWKNSVILAPMSKGSNLPFRRLCCDFGATVTVSEMIFASALSKGNRKDLALLRRAPQEQCFGVQVLTNSPEDLKNSIPIIEESGADFIDLNCGCPIDEAVNKGMGAQLLDRTKKLEQLLGVLKEHAHIPYTVKLRAGYKEGHINIETTSSLAEKYGACAIAVHGRTREQRYTGAADWDIVRRAVDNVSIPVIGNGDILTWYEAKDRLLLSRAQGIMIGRGALIKPWIFQEIREKRDLALTPKERAAIYLQLTNYMLEHFGNDTHGQRTVSNFLVWHFDLFSRYRYLPEEQYHQSSRQHPLIQTRLDNIRDGDPLEIVFAGYGKSFRQKLANAFVLCAADQHSQNWLHEELAALAPELEEQYARQAQQRAEKKAAQEQKKASANGLPFCEIKAPLHPEDKTDKIQALNSDSVFAVQSANVSGSERKEETAAKPSVSGTVSSFDISSLAIGTPHIHSRPEQFAPSVLMPGDPLRARFIAENYLEHAGLVNNVRSVRGYTGFYKGKRVSVMASGMGGPSMGIYSHELFAFMGVEKIIRIGTCGGMQPYLKLGDIVLAQGCCTNSNFISQFQLNGTFAPLADFELLLNAYQFCQEKKLSAHTGNILTSDYFYDASNSYEKWSKLGILACEMEGAVLYTNAALHGKKALTILTVSEVLGQSEILTAQQRQNSLHNMIELALYLA